MSVVIALDFGVKKMGIAVGNTDICTAQALDIFQMNNGQPDWAALLSLIDEWQAKRVLVGLPLHIDGSESHLSKRAHKFAKRLNHKLKEHHIICAVTLVDERLSSQEAKQAPLHASSRNKTKANAPIDDKAACIFLESWLNEPSGDTLA